jgi:hypothetical protein
MMALSLLTLNRITPTRWLRAQAQLLLDQSTPDESRCRCDADKSDPIRKQICARAVLVLVESFTLRGDDEIGCNRSSRDPICCCCF